MTIRYLCSTLSGVHSEMFKRMMYVFLRLLFSLFVSAILTGIMIFAGWGISAVGRIFGGLQSHVAELVMRFVSILVASTGAIIFVFSALTACLRAIKDLMRAESSSLSDGALKTGRKGEMWAVGLGWWIPRKYRDAIVGDILEDCKEMGEMGCGEWRICVQVIWQWAIAVGTLIPAAAVGSIWRKLNPPK